MKKGFKRVVARKKPIEPFVEKEVKTVEILPEVHITLSSESDLQCQAPGCSDPVALGQNQVCFKHQRTN